MSEQGLKDIRKDAPASHELTEDEKKFVALLRKSKNKPSIKELLIFTKE